MCKGVRTERLSFLADVNRYTDRYAEWVGRQCREKSVKAVAEETGLGWDTVKDLDIIYMRKQLKLNPVEPPRVIGIDELAIGQGHSYRVVVHDLERRRPIWFGDERGRTQEVIDSYYQGIPEVDRQKIDLAVMDMWKPYRKSTEEYCPNAKIHFDHFHIAKHLSVAIDDVRRAEYGRVSGEKRKYIKGSRYILLSNREIPMSGLYVNMINGVLALSPAASGAPVATRFQVTDNKINANAVPCRKQQTHVFSKKFNTATIRRNAAH